VLKPSPEGEGFQPSPNGTLRARYKGNKLKAASNRLSTILQFDQKSTMTFVQLNTMPDCPYKKFPEKIKVYLEIEKELINLSEEKDDEYSTVFEDYGSQLLSPAIERAAGNLVGDVKNDLAFSKKINELIPKCNYMYYRTACKYKLPTMRIVPFIIRLIT